MYIYIIYIYIYIYIYSLLNSCGYWTLNKCYYYSIYVIKHSILSAYDSQNVTIIIDVEEPRTYYCTY